MFLLIVALNFIPIQNICGQQSKIKKEKIDSSSRGSEIASIANAAMPEAKRFALIIGIDQYDGGLTKLSGAVNDAEFLADALKKYAGFSEEQMTILTSNAKEENKKPTRNNILEQFDILKSHIETLNGNAMLLVSFAGHGKDAYLFSADAKTRSANLLENTAISIDLLKKEMLVTKAKQLFLILDSCRDLSDGARGRDKQTMSEALTRELDFSKNRRIECFIIMLATSLGLSAYEA